MRRVRVDRCNRLDRYGLLSAPGEYGSEIGNTEFGSSCRNLVYRVARSVTSRNAEIDPAVAEIPALQACKVGGMLPRWKPVELKNHFVLGERGSRPAKESECERQQ